MESISPAHSVLSKRKSAGFTLVELVVVCGIIVVVTSVVLTSRSDFNKTLLLKNTAYDFALMLRQAQSYGVSSRASDTLTNAGYGLDFWSANKTTFTFFFDNFEALGNGLCFRTLGEPIMPDTIYGDCSYNVGSDTKIADYTLGNGFTITAFCAYLSGAWKCSSGLPPYSDSPSLNRLNIVFTRPNPVPKIRTVLSDGTRAFSATKACWILVTPQSVNGYVSLTESGQIIANASSCPF